MMKKYRVNEVAKDLNVENKDVIEALKPFSDEPKKYMTALTEEDLDVVFDTFTKENSVESFDAYFAEREDAQPTSSSKEAPESKENTTAKVQEKAVVEKEKTAVKPAVKESKSNAANKNNKQTKPAAQKQEKTIPASAIHRNSADSSRSHFYSAGLYEPCGQPYLSDQYHQSPRSLLSGEQ